MVGKWLWQVGHVGWGWLGNWVEFCPGAPFLIILPSSHLFLPSLLLAQGGLGVWLGWEARNRGWQWLRP